MTTIETIRLLIHDNNTDISKRFFTDPELQCFYDLKGSVYGAASAALYSLAADKVRLAKSATVGAFSYDNGIAEIKELADEYKKEARSSVRSEIVKPHWK